MTGRFGVLSESDARRAFEKRDKYPQILRAIRHEEWVRMHSEPDFEPRGSAPMVRFLEMVK